MLTLVLPIALLVVAFYVGIWAMCRSAAIGDEQMRALGEGGTEDATWLGEAASRRAVTAGRPPSPSVYDWRADVPEDFASEEIPA